MTESSTLNMRGKAVEPNEATSTSFNGALLDAVDVKVETFLGETTMTVSDLKAMRAGSIITLNASLNEIVELRVNGVRIAYGELVAVGDQFGVRVISVAP